jgi:hypothetical protein
MFGGIIDGCTISNTDGRDFTTVGGTVVDGYGIYDMHVWSGNKLVSVGSGWDSGFDGVWSNLAYD